MTSGRVRHVLRWVGLLAACGFAGACLEPGPQKLRPSASSTSLPIIGGKLDLRHPAVGGLVESNRPFCTGTLIGSRLVLTAAHCVDSLRQSRLSFRIDLPSSSSTDGFVSQYYEIDNQFVKVHPQWTGNVNKQFDIAVVVLKKPVPSSVATPIPFNTRALDGSWVGRKLLFLGYGLIQSVPDAVSPKAKQGAEITVTRIDAGVIYNFDRDKRTCHGDSGGPALAVVDGRLVIVGVNSFTQSRPVPGAGRTRCDGPAGAARTDVYARFIQTWADRFGDGPKSCKAQEDCLSNCNVCKPAAAMCERKEGAAAATFCRPCRVDGDCKGSSLCHRFDQGFRCIQRCPADGCCPSGSRCTAFTSGNTSDWFCIPDGFRCPPIDCKADADCGPGEACKNEQCQALLPARASSLCAPCSKRGDCVDKSGKQVGYCIKSNGQGYCSQPCGKADFCPSGFRCRHPHAGIPKQCVPADGTCRIPCSQDADCPTDFACQQDFCTRKGGGGSGEFCDPMPCQSDHLCISTSHGRRCHQPCEMPPGVAGSECLSNGKCTGTALCYTVSEDANVCFQPCKSDAECNGASCAGGVCKCTTDKDCAKDHFCHGAKTPFPSCQPISLKRPCPSGFQCHKVADGKYCSLREPGAVALGQPCDGVHRCRPGLICIKHKDEARCLEDCTASRSCTLGGNCSAEQDGVAVCVCTGDEQCSAGRKCTPAFYQGQFGYCVAKDPSSPCRSSLECTSSQICQSGACVPGPKQPSEGIKEPGLEPPGEPPPEPQTSPDASVERSLPETAAEPPKEPLTPDKADPPRAETGAPPPKGCAGCSSVAGAPPLSSVWALLLALFFARRKP